MHRNPFCHVSFSRLCIIIIIGQLIFMDFHSFFRIIILNVCVVQWSCALGAAVRAEASVWIVFATTLTSLPLITLISSCECHQALIVHHVSHYQSLSNVFPSTFPLPPPLLAPSSNFHRPFSTSNDWRTVSLPSIQAFIHEWSHSAFSRELTL